jgi:hypothetical protein
MTIRHYASRPRDERDHDMTASAGQPFQQWDYRCLTYWDANLETVRDKVTETARELGQQGWEMVNASLTHTKTSSGMRGGSGVWYFTYSVLCYFKRPIG